MTGDQQAGSVSNAVDAQMALPISTLACKLRQHRIEEINLSRAGVATMAEKPSPVFPREDAISA
jgi:hypothetical protein